jgi:hypothetical protein
MAFATIDMTKGITGTIPVANGGTGLASGTTGQFLKFTGTTTLASAADNGKVGQVIQNVITSGNTAATSTTFTATSHEVVITPSATSSNIFLMFSFGQGTQTNNRYARFRFYRDIGGAGYSALTDGVDSNPHEQGGTFKASASGQITGPCTLQFYDDPATTAQCTYKVYISLQDTSGTVNIYGEDDNYGYATAMEVLA